MMIVRICSLLFPRIARTSATFRGIDNFCRSCVFCGLAERVLTYPDEAAHAPGYVSGDVRKASIPSSRVSTSTATSVQASARARVRPEYVSRIGDKSSTVQ